MTGITIFIIFIDYYYTILFNDFFYYDYIDEYQEKEAALSNALQHDMITKRRQLEERLRTKRQNRDTAKTILTEVKDDGDGGDVDDDSKAVDNDNDDPERQTMDKVTKPSKHIIC